jgi:hypothetical protein
MLLVFIDCLSRGCDFAGGKSGHIKLAKEFSGLRNVLLAAVNLVDHGRHDFGKSGNEGVSRRYDVF